MTCPACHARHEAEAAYCDRCGAPLTVGCPACGTTNRAGARFCRQCGLPLDPSASVRTGPLEGERKQITVLFADMKGSMELLAGRDPEEARAMLDPVLEHMIDAVRHHGGTVNQVLGDGIMALFGAPVACEDHAVRACLAALRMLEAVRRYARELPPPARGVAIRVGLNSGEVVVRALRGDLHLEYTAVGDVTHLAARMEQLAAPGTALATAATARLVEGHVILVPRGEASVRGIAAPVPIFEVAGVRRPAARSVGTGRAPSPFVGRGAELARLAAAWADARGGRGRLVTLVGAPGVGKSRLLEEFVASVRGEAPSVLQSDPPTWEAPAPYAWIADLLRRHFEIETPSPPEEVRARVEGRVGQAPGLKPLLVPLLALVGALPEDDPLRALAPRRRRQLLQRAFVQVVVEQSRARPVVAVFENLHAMDSASAAALEELAARVRGERVLVLATARPGTRDRWIDRHAHDRLVVGPLDGAEAERLLRALLGAAPELEAVRHALVARTEGHPFFLEECVRALEEAGVLVGGRGAYRLARRPELVQLPPTVQATVAARIDRLAPDDKHLLQAAAVIGRDFRVPLLSAVAGLPTDPARRSLARLVSAELVEVRGPGPGDDYRFSHALVQEVAYASLLHERRRALHARVVEHLEAARGASEGEFVERLAHHAWHGGLWAKAAAYLRRAGARATARAANAEAVVYLERALEALSHLPASSVTLAESVDIRLDLRPPLLQLGRLEEVLGRSLEAERLATALGDGRRLAAVYSYLANYHYLRGEPEVALGYAERCLTLAERAGDTALVALATRYMAHIHHALGDYARAAERFATGLSALAAEPAPAEPEAHLAVGYPAAAAWLAFTWTELGDFAAAHRFAREAEHAASVSRHPYGGAIAATLGALVWLRQGDAAAALEPLERSLAACREHGLALWEPVPTSLLGLTLALLGRTEDALPLLEAAVGLSERLGVRAYVALWTLHVAQGQLLGGTPARAAQTAQRALDLAIAHRERGHEAWAHWLQGEIAQHDAHAPTGAAERAYERALRLAEALGMRPLVARAHLGLGRVLPRGSAAADHLVQALAMFSEMEMDWWARPTCQALAALGRLVVVARERPALYRYLTEVAGQGLTVILDRRMGDRRRSPTPRAGSRERRRAERRRQDQIARQLATHGLAVVA